jgi:hydrogenase large subunit
VSLEALDWQKDVIRMHALLGAKNPHCQTYLVGGVAIPVDPKSQNALNAGSIAFMQEIAEKTLAFVKNVHIPDLLAIASFYKDWAIYGGGVRNYMSYGAFPNDNDSNTTNCWLPSGIILNNDLSKVHPVDPARITEYVTHSWYEYKGGNEMGLQPYVGETIPNYTGPKPPYQFLETDKKYSWVKSPRYEDRPMQVGPLSRMLIAYAAGHKRVKEVSNSVLRKLGVGPPALFSTLGRVAARGIETLLTAEMIPVWIEELAANMKSGKWNIHNDEKWDPSTGSSEASGYFIEKLNQWNVTCALRSLSK